MEKKEVLVEKKEHLTIITLNRPEVMNAVNPIVSLEIEKAFDDFNQDPDAWVCIITGAGDRGFCLVILHRGVGYLDEIHAMGGQPVHPHASLPFVSQTPFHLSHHPLDGRFEGGHESGIPARRCENGAGDQQSRRGDSAFPGGPSQQ